jgi:hypothetical protein
MSNTPVTFGRKDMALPTVGRHTKSTAATGGLDPSMFVRDYLSFGQFYSITLASVKGTINKFETRVASACRYRHCRGSTFTMYHIRVVRVRAMGVKDYNQSPCNNKSKPFSGCPFPAPSSLRYRFLKKPRERHPRHSTRPPPFP